MKNSTGTTPRHLTERLLHNRNFVFLWCAYAISALGDHLSEMAILKTQGALDPNVDVTPINARMTFMFFLPFLFIGPFGGVLADRFPRRMLMVTADVARAALMFAFAGLIGWTQTWGAWGPFLPLLSVGVFAAVFSPARSALLPTLIRPDQLVRANGMIGGLGIMAAMGSAYLGGVLAQRYAPTVSFKVDAVTFLVSAVLLLMVSPPRRATTVTLNSLRSALTSLSDGLRYFRSHRRVRELLAIAALVWFCGPLVNTVIPAVVRDVYHGNYQTMSQYRAFLGAGFLLGSLIITVLGDALRSEIGVTWGLIGVGAGVFALALSVFLPFEAATLGWLGAIATVVIGTFGIGIMAGQASLLQRSVADRFRGRVFGIQDLCCMAALLIATGALGVPQWTRIDRWIGYILLAVAGLTFSAGLITLFVRLRRGPHGPGLNFAEHLNEFIARFWYRLRREGRATVPRSGAVIVAANHTCTADPMLLCAAATYRPLGFMIAKEYANWPLVRFWVRVLDCIPVTRSGQDTAAFKSAVRHLQAGKAIGVFIEGRIVPPGEEGKPRDGVAMMALKTGATVIPAHISGTVYRTGVLAGLFGRHRALVRFGKPVDLGDLVSHHEDIRQAAKVATARIYAAILQLAPDSSAKTANETSR